MVEESAGENGLRIPGKDEYRGSDWSGGMDVVFQKQIWNFPLQRNRNGISDHRDVGVPKRGRDSRKAEKNTFGRDWTSRKVLHGRMDGNWFYFEFHSPQKAPNREML